MNSTVSSGPDDRDARTNTRDVRWIRIGVLVCLVIAIYMLARWIDDLLIAQLNLKMTHEGELILHRTIMTATAAYIILMAIPFMPSAEIGLSLLLIFGAKIAFLVYVSTAFALTLAYLLGRLMPIPVLARVFGFVGLRRAQNFLIRVEPLSPDERISLLVRNAPTRFVPLLIRHRFIALAILLNIPGNIVIGGGGAIGLVAGMSRLFPFPIYLLTILLAVAPVPLIVYLTENA